MMDEFSFDDGPDTYEVCGECLMFEAGVGGPRPRDGERAEFFAHVAVCFGAAGEGFFSRCSCECCGEEAAGERFYVPILRRW